MTDPADFIRAHLPIVEVPGVPGIRLHRADPSSGLRRLTGDAAGAGSPYWAFFWPGGLALARYVLDHPESVMGKTVLDLGAGSGLVGITAARMGARHVIASETDPNGQAASKLNAGLNAVDIETTADDLTAGMAPSVDVILVGDLFYARSLARRVAGFLGRCREAGCDVLIGDPRRAFLPTRRLRQIAAYDVCEVGGSPSGPAAKSFVFAFEPKWSKSLA